MPTKRKTMLLIDGSHALFRAFYAIRNMRGPDGKPTNAIFGWTSMLLKLIADHQPDYIAACFDGSAGGFRAEIDPNYKANRADTPPELAEQWPTAMRVTRELGVTTLEDPLLEADDIIATLATQAQGAGVNVLICSGDKDLMALVHDGDGGPWVRQLEEKRGQTITYDEAGVIDKWAVKPSQIGDLLAIMGDSVDNIPGVKGIGKKGAVNLVQQWGSFEAIYENIDDVTTARTQQLLRDSEEQARLSRRLVALVTDAPLGLDVEELAPDEPDKAALTTSFGALGFKRLLRQYFADEDQVQVSAVAIDSVAALRAAVEKLRKDREMGLDVLTDQRDEERHWAMRGQLLGVGLSGEKAGVFSVLVDSGARGMTGDLFAPTKADGVTLGELQQVLGPLLADPSIRKVGHDLKYSSIVLRRAGMPVAGLTTDTLLAAYLGNAGRARPGLSHLGIEHARCRIASVEDTFGGGRNRVEPADADKGKLSRWLGEHAAVPRMVAAALRKELAEAGLEALHDELELPLTEILAQMEHRGVLLDTGELQRQSAQMAQRCDELQRTIWGHAGGVFNIGSPKQLGEVLFETLGLPAKKKTRTGYSTDQAVLEGLRDAHPIIEEIFAWRRLTKLQSTYTDALPALVNPDTGRVHTNFNQAVAATGRLSSAEPNLQNIPIRTPEGKRVREAFIAADGHVLLSADYSQIELRVMAHLADEPTMQAAFRDGQDIHRQTAAELFGVPLAEVTSEQRGAAKTINFGVLYGMGPVRLAASIGVSRKEAKAFIESYFARFSRVKEWVEATLEGARQQHEVRTMFGRRRIVAEINSGNHMVKAGAERIAVNTPVQGSAADIIKRAMIAVQRRIDETGSAARLLLQVHDELVLEVPEFEQDAVLALVSEAMAGAAELSVPLKVDARCARSWALAH